MNMTFILFEMAGEVSVPKQLFKMHCIFMLLKEKRVCPFY